MRSTERFSPGIDVAGHLRRWWAARAGVRGDASAAMFRHIRLRLTLWYSGVLASAFLLFGVALYVGVYNALLNPVQGNLELQATRVSATIQAGIHVFGLSRSFCGPGSPAGFRPLFRPTQYWACFDATGTLRGASQLAIEDSQLQSDTLVQQALRDGHAGETANGGPNVGVVQRYALAVPSADGKSTLGVIVVGTNIDHELNALHILLVLLLLFGALALLFAAAGGLFLADRALAPARLAFARQQSFIADAAHELRTPLTLLRADAEVLLRGRARLPADDAELLEDIVGEASHMATLATNMLTLARLDTGHLHLDREVVNLVEVAATTAHRALSFAADTGITVEARSGVPALVIGNRPLLEQAALILLDNAIKYNRPGGRVVIGAGTSGERAMLTVSDTGIGIPPEHLPHLGERFYRIDKARSREAGGAGLGLSIARGIATLHSGKLTLASEPGQGTVATMALPAARAVAAAVGG